MKRMLALILVLVTVLGLVPASMAATNGTPQNLRWYSGSSLMAMWDDPADLPEGTEVYYDIIIYYSPDGNAPWVMADHFTEHMKDAYTLQSHVVAKHGEGHYKFSVRCKYGYSGTYGDWVEGPSYPLGFSAVIDKAPTPIPGTFDPLSGLLTWTGTPGALSIVETWYTGADGKADPVQVGRYATISNDAYWDSMDLDLQALQEGYYTFTVSAFSENYLKYAESDSVTLPGSYHYVPAPAMEAPADVAWNAAKAPSWNGQKGDFYYELELMYSSVALDDPAGQFSPQNVMTVSFQSEYASAGELWLEVERFAHQFMGDMGKGWYYFRVRVVPYDLNEHTCSGWVCSAGLFLDPTPLPAPTDLSWHQDYSQSSGGEYAPGHIAFRQVPGAKEYRVHLFRSADGSTTALRNIFLSSEYYGEFVSFDMTGYVYPDCSFFFSVEALGDGINTSNSATATSDTWHYTKPDVTLAVSDLSWKPDDLSMHWVCNREDLVDYYQVQVYRTEAETDPVNPYAPIITFHHEPQYGALTLDNSILSSNGEGWYWFQVTPFTNNILLAANGQASELSGGFHYEAPENKMPAPSNVQWHYTYNEDDDLIWLPGAISFRGQENTRYQIRILRILEDREEEYRIFYHSTWNKYISMEQLVFDSLYLPDGTYVAEVQAMGDGVTTSNSVPVRSQPWVYTRPAKTLTLADPVWNREDMTIQWKNTVGDSQCVFSYQAEFAFNPDADDVSQAKTVDFMTFQSQDSAHTLPLELLSNHGEGWFYYRLRPISGDLTRYGSGDWTDWSAALHYQAPDVVLSITDPGWAKTGLTTQWKEAFDHSLAYKYDIIYYYSAAADETITDRHEIGRDRFDPEELPMSVPTWLVQEYGPGWYYYKIQAIPADPFQAASGGWSVLSAGKHFTGPDTTAPAPSDLQWHLERYDEDHVWNTPGCASFAAAPRTEYRVEVFRQETTGDVSICTFYCDAWNESFCTVSPFDEHPALFDTGSYYFTVTALGDGVTTTDSKPVKSPLWHYTRPNVSLAVSQPKWNADMSMTWKDSSPDTTADYYYQVEFRINPNEDDPDEFERVSSMNYHPGDEPFVISANVLERLGEGWYYFRVRAISEDLTAAVTSPWTELSAGIYYQEPDVSLEVTDPKWDPKTFALTWTDQFQDQSLVDYYEIRIYFAEDEDDLNEKDWNMRRVYPGDDFALREWILEEYGPGYYWASVRAVSNSPLKASTGPWSALSQPLHFTGPETKLSAPTDLQWNIEYHYDGTSAKRMGVISFRRGKVDQARYELEIYRMGEKDPVASGNWTYGSTNKQQYLDMTTFIYEDLPSGTYYFRIRAKGDQLQYAHSDWVTSGTWTYTQPAQSTALPAPTGLTWDDTTDPDQIRMCWEPVKGAGYYDVDIYHSPVPATSIKEMDRFAGNFDIHADDDNWVLLHEDALAEKGSGYYYFRVRAIAADITKERNGLWSAISPAFSMVNVTDQVSGALNDVLNTLPAKPTAGEIQEAVKDVSEATNMAAAMAADQDNSGVVEQLKELEAQTKIQISVDTKGKPDQFVTEGVEIVGAALNAGANAKEVSLEIKKPSANVVIPAQYHNTLGFSMDIPGAVDADGDASNGRQLAVPVKITLPVPSHINPAFLVVLHHEKSKNSSSHNWVELMDTHVYQENGKWFVSFVVDSFSDFAFGHAVSASLIREDQEVFVSLETSAAAEDRIFICAAYTKSSQLLGVSILKADTPFGWIPLGSRVDEADHVKVFTMTDDGTWMPLSGMDTLSLS